MKLKICCVIFSAWLLLPVPGNAQPGYRIGVSRRSIEPDRSLVSLHLGGYGAPREGRFTLQWNSADFLPGTSAIGGDPQRIFIVRNAELLERELFQTGQPWKKTGNKRDIVAITGNGEKIYGADASGNFFSSGPGKKIAWRKTGIPGMLTISLACSPDCLYSLDPEGSIWMIDPEAGTIGWTGITTPDGVISIAAIKRKLYALTGDGIIYQCEPSSGRTKWLKAAGRNNETLTEDIRMITIAGNGIYGFGSDGYLYEGDHRSEGNLSVRTMAITGGSDTFVIASADVCGFDGSFTGLVKNAARDQFGLPPEAIFINSIHTHFAPVSQNWLTWQEANQRPDSTYLYSTVANAILSSIGEALDRRMPARIFFGRGNTDIGYNRSLPKHPELYDSSVDVLKIRYTETGRESYLFLASCHPVFSTAGKLHYTISANFPGVARKLVEERTGTACSIFIQGTAGDINPRDDGEYITGEKLANEVVAVSRKPMTEITGKLSFFLDTVNMPVEPWSKDKIEQFREENAAKPGDIYAEKNVKWSDIMLTSYEKGTVPSSLPVYIHTLNLGSWKLVGFSRETTTEYGFGVKKLWPEELVSVAGYTNDVSSYLPTSLHIEAGNYEGYDSFFWYCMPAIFPLSVYTTILNAVETLHR